MSDVPSEVKGAVPEGLKGVTEPIRGRARSRPLAAIALMVALMVAYWGPLGSVARLAAGSEVYSYILIVPLITAYLCFLRRAMIPRTYSSSWALALIPAALGLAALFAGSQFLAPALILERTEALALQTLSFLCFLLALVLLVLGRAFVAALAFPAFFLFFMTPLPAGLVDSLETASKLGSAEADAFFFQLFHLPAWREGVVFVLPGIVIEVAQECSGIRSSLVLCLTGLLAANLCLRSPWRRAILLAVLIPLGLLRNGFRVFTIAYLCVHYGAQWIHSPVHTRGGPLFFALSLLPLGGLLWALAAGERRQRARISG